MSEFSEVVMNMARMCNSYDEFCDAEKCKLYDTPLCKLAYAAGELLEVNKLNREKLDDLDFEVSIWAEKNPEPLYPTWLEWLVEQGVLLSEEPILDLTTAAYCACSKISTRIPEEMAKKLDIKPINDVEEIVNDICKTSES